VASVTVCVCRGGVCVCIRALKEKRAIGTKLGTCILYDRTLACIDLRSKGQGHRVMKCAAGVGMHVDMTA